MTEGIGLRNAELCNGTSVGGEPLRSRMDQTLAAGFTQALKESLTGIATRVTINAMSRGHQIERLFPELRAYARSISDRLDAAEDLVQDAVERALRHDDRPTELSDLRPWMFRIIRNLRYDELRKFRVRREYLAREKRLSNNARELSDPERDILFRLAFERLPPEKREVLFLVDVIGLKYAEAAEVMGVASGTVMSRLSRARQALRNAVDGTTDQGHAKAEGGAS